MDTARNKEDDPCVDLKNKTTDTSDQGGEILKNEAISDALSIDKTKFKEILDKGTWHAGQLLHVLNRETFDEGEVNAIFDYWGCHKERLDEDFKNNCENSNDVWCDGGWYGKNVSQILDLFLEKNKPELFNRMLELLPNKAIAPIGMEDTLLMYSYPQPEQGVTVAALTKEQRNKLIQKSYLLSGEALLQQLRDYYNSFVNSPHATEELLEAQFDVLAFWIQSAEVKAQDVATFMTTFLSYASAVLNKTSAIQFIDGLLTHYANQMDDVTKKSILEAMPATYGSKATWTAKWQSA